MTTMHIGLDKVGQWTQETVYVVDPAHTMAYASATNDDHPWHAQGMLAPPLFAVVPVGEHIARALEGLVAEDDRRWGLHAAQDVVLHSPIVPGRTIVTRAAPVGVYPRPLGTEVLIKAETRAADGGLLVEQYVTLLFRRKFSGPGRGESAPDHRAAPDVKAAAKAAGRLITVTDVIDPDQTTRYAAASGDRNPIHLDEEFARSVGLPGIIVHGMCTMAFAGRAVIGTVCGNDPRRLRRLAVRFARPVLPGQAITTYLWAAGVRGSHAAHAFETVNPAGKAVLVDGLAEVAPAS
ncbi:MAG: MaoC/PaaZ C-terminal domain-containing protein [Armatimonadota bacterium]|nr:MaoC/PaaZ C-terminal domain-containing protein [Armatimonadota bacterium]